MEDIEVIPYLTFGGDCEEALNTYKDILGGEVIIVSRYDAPEMKAPEHYKNKILHARYEFSGNTIMASDMFPGSALQRGNSDTALSISMKDEKKATDIYNKLSQGGRIGVPFEKQFWGDWHGNFVDRFGIKWMINC
jgi:PhnB protein